MADGKTNSNAPAAGPGPSPDPQPQPHPTDYNPGLVSVIIPAYNRERLIVEALDSVRAQTYRPIETLVVDDGSTDNTVAVCRQIAEQWKTEPGLELRVFEQPHKGACAARNLGLRESKGEFIQFLDSDDLLVADSIEKRLAHMAPGIDAVFGDVLHCDATGIACGGWSYEDTPTEGAGVLYHLRKNIHTASPIHRKSGLHKTGGFKESLTRGQETELHARLLLSGRVFAYTHTPAVVFRRDGNDRISNRNWMYTDPFGYLRAFRAVQLSLVQVQANDMSGEIRDQISARMLYIGIELVRHWRFFTAVPYFWEARRAGNGRKHILANYNRMGRIVCSCVGVYFGEILRATMVTPFYGIVRRWCISDLAKRFRRA
jgi:glycosyltransferase involved in cell wall biosynthesis